MPLFRESFVWSLVFRNSGGSCLLVPRPISPHPSVKVIGPRAHFSPGLVANALLAFAAGSIAPWPRTRVPGGCSRSSPPLPPPPLISDPLPHAPPQSPSPLNFHSPTHNTRTNTAQSFTPATLLLPHPDTATLIPILPHPPHNTFPSYPTTPTQTHQKTVPPAFTKY